ncbi:endonuclease/exonuclease/phosphatase family protein [Streptacidiphilus jiangxiensis]|uniref:Exonuclease III n=1 Tax=Streptacidiphilus jiangxiensis TaxID=235985 RepID=A0A1H8BAE4_STRJI|nr:endonuclease/exonuclease/phosphatase family protein [Streptacidiphilus jiangxiensis]SEM79064.1 Exonuclease III [Streptacidiphilus jiangxiensis]
MSDADLTIVTFNSLFGGWTDFGFGEPLRRGAMVEFLRGLQPDILCLQELNGYDLLGRRRLHQLVNDLDLTRGFLAEANETTSGHRFHSAILLSDQVRVEAEGADRTRYHHVLGWAKLRLSGLPGMLLELRNVHLDPFDPSNRAREVAPFEVLAAPGVLSIVAGDANTIGADFPEPEWGVLPPHLLNGHLRSPSDSCSSESDREAVALLRRAGFVDSATATGNGSVPTAAFEAGDVPRRQDLVLLSPALAPALTGYTVHREPVDLGFSDHCAVGITLSPNRLSLETP